MKYRSTFSSPSAFFLVLEIGLKNTQRVPHCPGGTSSGLLATVKPRERQALNVPHHLLLNPRRLAAHCNVQKFTPLYASSVRTLVGRPVFSRSDQGRRQGIVPSRRAERISLVTLRRISS